jgi:nucleotide-binding universal stress UspA family protein
MKALDTKTRVQVKNILFATDFSPAAAAALPYAEVLAKRFGANLFALHVRTPVINPMTPPAGWPALEKAAELEEIERRKSLRNAVPGIEPTVLMEEGGIWENLHAAIQKFRIDLLVIGTHGRSGFGKLLLGSAAEEIFRDAPCPVLTVGPHATSEPNQAGEFTRILYAASFSAESTAAAPYAVSLAQEYQARLTLLHVLENPEAELWCEPDYVVERGAVGEKILDVAKNRHADLIVLGVHRPVGVPGAATHLPIATAHHVVANAHCPVLTVRD